MVVSQAPISDPSYYDLTLGGAEVKEVKSPRILGATFDSRVDVICGK